MKDVERRIAALEQENAVLKGQLEALRVLLAPNKAAAPQRDEPRVRIMTPPLANVLQPTENELHRLLHIILGRFPVLAPREDPAEYAAQFRSAFIRLLHCGRRDKIDNERRLTWWLDDCREWCQQHQVNPDWVGGAPFTAAAIGHGDVEYTIADWPHDTAFALQFGGGGRPSGGWWKRALGGVILEPTPPRYPVASPSPARARQVVGRFATAGGPKLSGVQGSSR
jgi:hypothetical protein